MRIGHGYDVHRFCEDRPLVIGGVTVPYLRGLAGHSDADVLIHAVIDSLLGAAALGDIGVHFPDSDPTFNCVDSIFLLKNVCVILEKNAYKIKNIDSIIVAQEPKFVSFLPEMRHNIANACEITEDCVSVKATTEEGLGFTGTLEGIAAHSVCLIGKKRFAKTRYKRHN
jgi:2-C-methyl-D-erythritol 2,4-cyclodiphosphate synthase